MLRIDIGNYRGDLHIKELDGKHYWAVECDMDGQDEWEWKEIMPGLYAELVRYYKLDT